VGGSLGLMKSVHSRTYRAVIKVLKDARREARLTQQQLAERIGRPQSFVAKIERRERRIDVAEFIQIAEAIGENPKHLFSRIVERQ
jgi:transcriptional regulator with XRE-family HTH domain